MVSRLAHDPGTTTPGNLFTPRLLLFIVGCAAIIWWMSRGRTINDVGLLSMYGVLLLWFSMLLVPVLFGWYLLPLFAVASIASSRSLSVAALTLGSLALLINRIGTVGGLYYIVPTPILRVAWMTAPLLAVLWAERTELVRTIRRLGTNLAFARCKPARNMTKDDGLDLG